MGPIKTILHPTDFSRCSEAALELACALARDKGARLVVLHAVPRPGPVPADAGVASLRRAEHYEQGLASYRAEMLDRLLELPLPGLQVRPERVLKEGEPAAAILAASEETFADLIVMGTHGRSAGARKLLGSVAEEVMGKATCPVVAVKTPQDRPHTDYWLSPAEEAGVIL